MLIRKAGSVSGNATVDFADGGYLYAEAEPYVSYGNDTRRMPGSVAGDGSIYALFSQAYDSGMPQSAAWEHITGFTGDVDDAFLSGKYIFIHTQDGWFEAAFSDGYVDDGKVYEETASPSDRYNAIADKIKIQHDGYVVLDDGSVYRLDNDSE